MTIEITDEMRKVAGAAVHDHLYDKPAPDYASPTGDDFQDIGLAALTAALPIIEKQARPEEAQPDTVHVGDETPLTLDAYQEPAAKTAVYPEDESVQYLIAGLAGEVGELASIFAKYWRGDGDLNHDHAAAELGDILWFVAMLAERLDTDLTTIAQGNLDKLSDRAVRGKLKGSGDNR